jgi:hypothetical protein
MPKNVPPLHSDGADLREFVERAITRAAALDLTFPAAWLDALLRSPETWLRVCMPVVRRPATNATRSLATFAGLFEALGGATARGDRARGIRALTYDLAGRLVELERRGETLRRYAGRTHGGPSDRVEFVRERLKRLPPHAPIFAAARALTAAGSLDERGILAVGYAAFFDEAVRENVGVPVGDVRELLATVPPRARQAFAAVLADDLSSAAGQRIVLSLGPEGSAEWDRALYLQGEAARARGRVAACGAETYLRETLGSLAAQAIPNSPRMSNSRDLH